MNLMIQKMRVYHEKKNNILQKTFLTDWGRFRPGQMRVNKSKKNVVPSKRDLVLIPADNHCDAGKYGIVEKILSRQTLKLRLRDGSELEKPINLVIPLVANCLLNSKLQ